MARRKFKNIPKRNREAERKKRTQIIVSVFFVGLMVFSILGIYVSQSQNAALDEFTYEDYSFDLVEETPGQAVLVTSINGQDKVFYSLPQDTLRIPVEGNVTAAIENTAYIAMANNPTPDIAPLIDLMRFDFDRYAQVLVASVPLATNNTQSNNVTGGEEDVLSVTGINCLNATAEIPVITLEQDIESSIVVEGSCVQIKSRPDDLFLIRDRLLYSLLGILDR